MVVAAHNCLKAPQIFSKGYDSADFFLLTYHR